MKKIARIITHCTDCEFSLEVGKINAGKPNFLICTFPDKEDFIIASSGSDNVLHYEHLIPNNCPLETYREI